MGVHVANHKAGFALCGRERKISKRDSFFGELSSGEFSITTRASRSWSDKKGLGVSGRTKNQKYKTKTNLNEALHVEDCGIKVAEHKKLEPRCKEGHWCIERKKERGEA